MVDSKVSQHTYAVAAWAIATFLVVTIALGSFAQARPTADANHPILISFLSILFVGALVTGVRARFRIGGDERALRLRRLALLIYGGVFVIATPPALISLLVGGEAGLYDHWRAVLPRTFGFVLAVLGLTSGTLFCWEVLDAVSEVRGRSRGRTRFLALMFLAIGAFFALAGLSAFIVGRAFFLA